MFIGLFTKSVKSSHSLKAPKNRRYPLMQCYSDLALFFLYYNKKSDP